MSSVRRARKLYGNYIKKMLPAGKLKSGLDAADRLLSYVDGKEAKKASQPGAVIKGTGLKSYLDRTYQKKCGVEIKHKLVANSLAPTTTLALGYTPFDDIPTGTLDYERTGNSIECKRVRFRCILTNSSATVPTFVRLIWVWCKNYNGSTIALTQILNTTTNIMSFPPIDEGRGVKILRDKTIPLGVTTSDTSRKEINFGLSFPKCKSIRWTQASTTGDVAEMQEGFIGLYTMAADATITSIVYYAEPEWVDV